MSLAASKHRAFDGTKQIVAGFVDEAGGTKSAAFHIGRSARQVYAYADEAQDDQISFDAVRRLTAATGATLAAEALARDAGGYFTPGEPSDDTFAALMAQEEAAHGRMMADLMRRVGVAAKEGPDPALARDIDAVMAALAAARARAMR